MRTAPGPGEVRSASPEIAALEDAAVKLRCTYHEGMFSQDNNIHSLHGPLGVLLEHKAACFHEAGHAIVGNLLGLGCGSVEIHPGISLSEDGTPGSIGYGGFSHHGKTRHDRAIRAMKRGSLPARVTLGVSGCAGPAAERRFRFDNGMPLNLLGATEGDHEFLDNELAKPLGDERFVFLRRVWAKAQFVVQRAPVWAAICELAQRLLREGQAEDAPGLRVTSRIAGSEVRAVARKHGVGPGGSGVAADHSRSAFLGAGG
jgi:hypothetical protein